MSCHRRFGADHGVQAAFGQCSPTELCVVPRRSKSTCIEHCCGAKRTVSAQVDGLPAQDMFLDKDMPHIMAASDKMSKDLVSKASELQVAV